ncbi:Holliday junction branch migration protein RuvA [Olsenella sp. HMSC062G07]|uniref:Holliday junction branch migration protein RuvA n=1 Tax=Olsenella sp. HMSC062G07 TaxID=1739330 RepID=UPI0008A3995A|nr:Holliday junction branch migration protein RuvA [Olsenella sp. HMSC062G07]OFK24157.1 Holliday junction DNA helicase RuvA [Olsenella sp. HMSC062G07]
MIAQLTGTLVELVPPMALIDVGGVGFELGVSANTAAQLPPAGTASVTLLARLLVKESSLELFGFATREERAVFDRLIAVSGVGPKLALSVLSTLTPAALASTVALQDAERMAQVPGVGKRKAQRLLVELEGVFAKDVTLRGLVGAQGQDAPAPSRPGGAEALVAEATSALLSLGFTQQECELALADADAAGSSVERLVAGALRRLGGGA